MTTELSTADQLTTAQKLAQAMANTMRVPTYVVEQDGAYLVQDEDDLSVYFASIDPARIVGSYLPLTIEPTPIICGYCNGAHHIQQCQQLRATLMVDIWMGADLGGALCGMLWCDPVGFRALIESLSPARLVEYALSYIAFIREVRPGSVPTVVEVIGKWLPGRTNPAAAAMQVAA